jgi:hypothetical protein
MGARASTLPRESAKPKLPREQDSLPPDLEIEVRTLRGLFDLMEAQADDFERLVERAIGRTLWLDALDATPDLTRQADTWWNQDLVLRQAKEQLLRGLDRIVEEDTAKEGELRTTPPAARGG